MDFYHRFQFKLYFYNLLYIFIKFAGNKSENPNDFQISSDFLKTYSCWLGKSCLLSDEDICFLCLIVTDQVFTWKSNIYFNTFADLHVYPERKK